ncbi:MAG: DUF6541 family protein [Chloroflexota bacterium]|nr:DUF6541 family protein [Chloroflexota bacterium]
MTPVALILMLLPGLAWWAWLGKRNQDPLISLAQIIGVTLASISLLAELVFLLGGSLGIADIVGILTIILVLGIAGVVKNGLDLSKRNLPYLLIGLIAFGLVIAWRLYQAKDLLLPNWVDSQHHYLIVRTILENGGLPDTLSPALDVPFYYHYGFHAVTALFTGLSGLEIGEAMLLLGQVLNAAVGLSIYALGKTLWDDWRPAACAALLVSFATRMPAYYLSWGRYTLITGLVLLPLAMAISLQLLRKPHSKKQVITLALLTAGVLLSHYFTAVLLAVFLVILAFVYLIPRWDAPLTALSGFSGVSIGVVSGLVLAAPWLFRVTKYSTASTGVGVNLPNSIGTIIDSSQWDYIWQLLGPTSNHWLLLLAGIGLMWAIIKGKNIHFGLWTLILSILTLPWSFVLRPFRPDHFAIILFLPAVLWTGWFFWQVGSYLEKWLKQRWMSTLLLLLVVAGWTIWGSPLSLDILNSKTVLVTEADMEALNWVAENTPPDARFFINTAYWQSNTYRGVDGGGWLLPYTGRWSLVPTIFYGFSPDKDDVQKNREWGERASQITACSEDFWALVEEAHLGWIYIHEGVGSLKPKELEDCEGVAIVYENYGVFIYQFFHP